MTRLFAAALLTALGTTLGGCAAQIDNAEPFAGPVFADVDCRVSGTGTVVPKQNCNDLEVDDHTGAVVARSS